jgi:DNA-binding NarL/FixJ family response regulator
MTGPPRTGEEADMHQRPSGNSTRVDAVSALNDNDIQVLTCLADGNSIGQIATVLSVSRNTVRTRIRRIQGKLDVTDREATVRAAHQLGIVPIPRPRRPVS